MWVEEHRCECSKAGILKQGSSWVWNRGTKFDGETEGDRLDLLKERT